MKEVLRCRTLPISATSRSTSSRTIGRLLQRWTYPQVEDSGAPTTEMDVSTDGRTTGTTVEKDMLMVAGWRSTHYGNDKSPGGRPVHHLPD